MTKLLDADWLRDVQLSQLMIFSNKQNGEKAKFNHKRNCSRGNKIALENTNKAPKSGRSGISDVYIENYRLQELDKALQIYAEVGRCNFVMLIINK